MREKLLKQLSAWIPVILWGLIIFKFSSGTVPLASKVYWQDFVVKKTAHVLFFGFFAILIFRALRMDNVKKSKAAIFAVILALLYGASDEYHQMYTQGREARVRDVFIDGMGATLITLAVYYLPEKLNKKIFSVLKQLNLT